MSVFQENCNRFILEPSGQPGLRKCQLGAIWALKSYYTMSSNEIAALISMPTGSGKTAIMMASCFELKLSKILIIVPSKILRRQLCDNFRILKDLKTAGCIPADMPLVNVFEVEKRQSSREAWEAIFNDNDVVVAHPNSISPYFSQLTPVPYDLIDAVFIDEAHHSPAPTWKAINDYYLSIKRVFFTATPFRRDRRRMQAKLTYHYPIGKALDDGILRSVCFEGICAGIQQHDYDAALVNKALKVYRNEKLSNQNAAIIIRTDRIEDTKSLLEKYVDAGFNIDVIHSDRSHNVNAALVQQVREGTLDGLICVGIASEGLDIPNLKVAVLHATPRSIPYTIQFLGRISRQSADQEGQATLIANIDEVRGEVSELYKADSAWSRLIPGVIDEQMMRARFYRSNHAIDTDFQMPELNVFFSARVYETADDFQLTDYNLNIKYINIIHTEKYDITSPLVVVTSYDKPIEWAGRKIYIEDLLDVHIFYHIRGKKLLFELTTSEIVLKIIKQYITTGKSDTITYGRLYKTLSEFNQSDYIMVGLRNSVMKGASQPAYKTIIGSGVQASVRASEGRVFSTGHALLSLDEDNTWGIATKKGRVWAMKRGTTEEFKSWCDQLANLITDGPLVTSLPGLSFLAQSYYTDKIDEIPIAIIPDELFFRSQSILIHIEGHQPYRNIIPEIVPDRLDEQTGVLYSTLRIDDFEAQLIMDFNSENLWTLVADRIISLRVEKNENNVIVDTLQDVLNDYPLSLIMPNGDVIEGKNRIVPNREIEYIPSSTWVIKNWSNCIITSERYDIGAPNTRLPVMNKTIELIQPEIDINRDLLIFDDRANEIADLLWFSTGNRTINIIHCKASINANPGCRKADCDVLFAQALRSIHWISNPELLTRLEERMKTYSHIILGSQTVFDQIKENFRINEWNYKVILAQPGFKHIQVSKKDRQNNNVYKLAIPVYERIKGCMAELEIWCY